MGLGATRHALPPPVLDNRLRGFGTGPVVAIERTRRDVAIKLRPVGREGRLKVVKYFLGEPVRIGRSLHHLRRHRAEYGRLRNAGFAVSRQIVNDLATAGRMADMDG